MANFRSSHSISSWSAIGGLTKNPYVLVRCPCDSSAGSAVAVSAVAAAIGTETDGSLVCPGSINGIVALKPTLGLLSRTHIIPIAHSQDTIGPMTCNVVDAAILLSAMTGSDPADFPTAVADIHKTDYSAELTVASLKGRRLAVAAPESGIDATETDAIYAQAIRSLKAAGAVIVAIKSTSAPPDMEEIELSLLEYELKHDLNAYLASLPRSGTMQSLADLIAFNRPRPARRCCSVRSFSSKPRLWAICPTRSISRRATA